MREMDETPIVISDSDVETAVVISDSDVEMAEISSSSEDSESERSKKKKRKRKSASDEDYVPESPSKRTKKPKANVQKSGKDTKGEAQRKQTRPRKAVPKENAADTASSSNEKPKRGRKRKVSPAVNIESGDAKDEPEEKAADAPNSEKPKRGRKKKVTTEDSTESGDTKNEPQIVIGMEWTDAELVAELQQIEVHIARNIIRLLDEDNTIPFIARYRKELTNDMPPEKLRHVKDAYDMVKNVKHKAETVMKSIAKQNKLTPWLERCIKCARSINELDHIYAPYKPGSKRTLAERARQLGLEDAANCVMLGSGVVVIPQLVKFNVKGLDSEKEVELGLQHIIADVISKDKDVLDLLRSLKTQAHIRLESTKARASASKVNSTKASASASTAQSDVKPNKQDNTAHKEKVDVESKFENYFKFSIPVKFIKPHQVLAINRGENLKVLSVKINIPDWVLNRLTDFCKRHWLCRGYAYELRSRLFHQSVNDAYTRLLLPLLVRQVRSELTQEAERAAVDVFATNLKRLLLTPPLRGKTVLGIDPGYRNGCKLAITSATGAVLATDVIFPQFNKFIPPHSDENAQKLRNLALQHKCDVIGLGNGTACRETETYLSSLIQTKWFSPLDMKYTIVSEQGASIYSCSPIAQKEFPGVNPNMISAVSLARRLQDPLAELVKIEPKHLGVGMYQHDVPEKQLSTTLDEVVVECVSFVGVDVNTASDCILRKIAGLNASRAAKIIEWRSSNGCFLNRQQIKKVKGIGAKTFEQCSGFIRILPETARATDKDESASGSGMPKRRKLSDEDCLNPLDRTWIHPESYSVALRFLEKCDLNVEDLGKAEFISKVISTVDNYGISNLATELGIPEAQMKLISEGLQQKPGDDLRSQFQEPLFRRELTSMQDLSPGIELTGRVQNVTHFGTFVDIGVGTNGLIPTRYHRNISPQLGDRVKVKVLSVDINRQRISLELISLL